MMEGINQLDIPYSQDQCIAISHICTIKTFKSLGWPANKCASVAREVYDMFWEAEKQTLADAAAEIASIYYGNDMQISETDRDAVLFSAFALLGAEIANTIHRRRIAANN